ncbi:MAG: ADP-glyceromanno-heptose 6-epimerase [Gammaproteobacteria bacterium]|jgi:ADP-L-glycero-D-manno-heptose 6-epimerase
MIVVTGGAGFIGSNLVHALNAKGRDDIIVVDDLTDGHKFENIATARIADYLDVAEFRRLFECDPTFDIERIYHLGACSTTTEWDGRLMMDLNYAYSRDLLLWCARASIPVVYASSAAIYGGASAFAEAAENEKPLNVYGYSKYLLDRYVGTSLVGDRLQIVGLRYFNVYGPREQHKGGMASVAYHLNRQLLETGKVRLFEGCDGYADGEQRRDFVHVDDVVDVTLWFADHPDVSGVFNCGSGRAQTFNDVARAVIAWHGRGELEYIPFPAELKGAYQSFTEADLARLRNAGYTASFRPVDVGVREYLDWLNA